jgi:hypothetical protein
MLVAAEQKRDPGLRAKWRGNVIRFREQLSASGGDIPGLSLQAIERWGRAQLLELRHRAGGNAIHDMPTEERLVVATAVASGYIYLTHRRDWNPALTAELGLSVEEI